MSLVVCAVAVAVVAAVRSTWSPCGVSMLSTITPLAEASRGRRYRATAAWFVLGGAGGGLALGALAAVGAAAVHAVGPSRAAVLVVAAAAALAAAGLDGSVAGPRLPHHRRQVNELWLDRYRGWVYGVGFGAQIGFGLATFIMTAGVYLVVVLGVLSGRPLAAVAAGTTFGLVRGLAVLAGWRLTTPEALGRFHRRFEAWRRPTARVTVLVECVVALALATQAGLLAGLLAALAIAIAVLSLLAGRAEQPDARAGRSSVAAGPGWSAGAR